MAAMVAGGVAVEALAAASKVVAEVAAARDNSLALELGL